MPLGDANSVDEIIWSLEKNGVFSVKSAYRLGIDLSNIHKGSQSDPCKVVNLWKSLWQADPIPRAKVCGWKIINDIIPTKVNIKKKGIDLNFFCSLCGKKPESSSHLIWDCKVSKEA